MLEKINLQKILAASSTALLSAAAPTFLSILFQFFSVTGGVEYIRTESGNSAFYTVIVENYRSSAADIVVGFPMRADEIISWDGIATSTIQQEENRTGSLLRLERIPPFSSYSVMVRTEILPISQPLSFISGPPGYSLKKVDPIRYRIEWLTVLINFVLYAVMAFCLDIYFKGRLETLREKQAALDKRVDELVKGSNELKSDASELSVRHQRTKLYYGRMISMLEKQNAFWENAFTRIMLRDGADRQDARRLLSEIYNSLGLRKGRNDPRASVSTEIELLVDEMHRERFARAVRDKDI